MLRSHHLLSPPTPPPPSSHRRLPPLFHFLRSSSSSSTAARHSVTYRAAALPPSTEDAGGPIELPPSSPSPIFATDDDPSTLQVATSVLLTGAVSVFLFRSLRRRAARAKDLRVRSTGTTAKKDIKEEALERMKELGVAPVEAGAPPSPAQALLGAIAAGVIAVILYKFTTTIEASLNRQTISDNFSLVINSLMGIEKEEGQINIKDTVSSVDTVEAKSFDIKDRTDDA